VSVSERFAPRAQGDAIELTVRSEYAGQRAEAMRRRCELGGRG
jgi:hypothetical protein